MSSYFNSEDLAKFGQIGAQAQPLADAFFAYYGKVTGSDGALSKREKSLIALAIAHSEKCGYCIDAYTTACLEAGSNPEQMREAVREQMKAARVRRQELPLERAQARVARQARRRERLGDMPGAAQRTGSTRAGDERPPEEP